VDVEPEPRDLRLIGGVQRGQLADEGVPFGDLPFEPVALRLEFLGQAGVAAERVLPALAEIGHGGCAQHARGRQ